MAETLVESVSIVKHAIGKPDMVQNIRVEFCFYGIKEDTTDARNPKRETREITLRFIAVPLDMRAQVYDMMDQFAAHLAIWLTGFRTPQFDVQEISSFNHLTQDLFDSPQLDDWVFDGLVMDGEPCGSKNLWDLILHVQRLHGQSKLPMAKAPARRDDYPQAA